ncbi:MAG: NADH-quinone oxidoreductase subunit A [Aeropyrum sp.]|nr:NADH-quinone oxidoreductase subunit A [Aeropyrum sp.]MCE4616821.1 NADH-quinone oxidoreductase subunit A [Aeropyrum sp.]
MALVEALYDPAVMLLVGLVVIPLVVVGLTIGAVVFLKAITQGRRDVEEAEARKYLRYDAGNPPRMGDFRRKISMQYLGYLIMFLAVEPVVILMIVMLVVPQELLVRALALYLLILLVYAPLLYYGIKESRRIEAWALE